MFRAIFTYDLYGDKVFFMPWLGSPVGFITTREPYWLLDSQFIVIERKLRDIHVVALQEHPHIASGNTTGFVSIDSSNIIHWD